MNTTTILLDRVKASIGAASDYRLAKTLNWNPATISSYRTGRSQLDTAGVFRISELLGMSHAETLATLASIEAERARDDDTRATWQARLKKLGGVAATLTLAALCVGAPSDAAAMQQYAHRIDQNLLFSELQRPAPGAASLHSPVESVTFSRTGHGQLLLHPRNP